MKAVFLREEFCLQFDRTQCRRFSVIAHFALHDPFDQNMTILA